MILYIRLKSPEWLIRIFVKRVKGTKHVYIYIYVHICMCVCVCVCIFCILMIYKYINHIILTQNLTLSSENNIRLLLNWAEHLLTRSHMESCHKVLNEEAERERPDSFSMCATFHVFILIFQRLISCLCGISNLYVVTDTKYYAGRSAGRVWEHNASHITVIQRPHLAFIHAFISFLYFCCWADLQAASFIRWRIKMKWNEINACRWTDTAHDFMWTRHEWSVRADVHCSSEIRPLISDQGP